MTMEDDEYSLMERRKAYLASLNLTSGIKFCPTTRELIVDFLIPKLRRGEGVDDDEDRIKEADAYSLEPWDLWNRFSADDAVGVHLYAKLKRKSANMIERKVGTGRGKGTWHGETKPDEFPVEYILTETNSKTKKQRVVTSNRVFEIRTFSYRNPGHPEDRRWLMDEYKEQEGPNSDLVIFHLRKNPKKARGRRDHDLFVPSLLAAAPVTAASSSGNNSSCCTDVDTDERDPKRAMVVCDQDADDMYTSLGDLGSFPNYLGF
ncbi:hypothetical protein LINGRAPRIM_LOCUS825 [Linum grandiflorum]